LAQLPRKLFADHRKFLEKTDDLAHHQCYEAQEDNPHYEYADQDGNHSGNAPAFHPACYRINDIAHQHAKAQRNEDVLPEIKDETSKYYVLHHPQVRDVRKAYLLLHTLLSTGGHIQSCTIPELHSPHFGCLTYETGGRPGMIILTGSAGLCHAQCYATVVLANRRIGWRNLSK